jgi:hypothetical protein
MIFQDLTAEELFASDEGAEIPLETRRKKKV